jgi:hypothetical protein
MYITIVEAGIFIADEDVHCSNLYYQHTHGAFSLFQSTKLTKNTGEEPGKLVLENLS